MILPLIGGVLIDKIGINFSILLFSLLLVLGQGVFTVSGFMGTEDQSENAAFYVALAGRFIYGLGAESLTVCQSTVISRRFIGKELSLALALNVSVGRLGSVFNNYSMPPLANSTSLGFALLFGLSLWILSMIWGIVLIFFGRSNKKANNEAQASNKSEVEEFHWRDIKDFSLSFWLITWNWIFTYVGLYCFNNISNDYFVKRYGFSQGDASIITSNIFLVSVFLSPIWGAVTDKIGHKVTFWIISTCLLALSHVWFYVVPSSTPENKSYLGIIPVILMGISYSVYVSTLWPMVPFVVKHQVVGSAYGMLTSSLNIGWALGPFMVGALTFNSKNEDAYEWVTISLGIWSLLGALSLVGLLISDKIYFDGILQKPSDACFVVSEDTSESLIRDSKK